MFQSLFYPASIKEKSDELSRVLNKNAESVAISVMSLDDDFFLLS